MLRPGRHMALSGRLRTVGARPGFVWGGTTPAWGEACGGSSHGAEGTAFCSLNRDISLNQPPEAREGGLPSGDALVSTLGSAWNCTPSQGPGLQSALGWNFRPFQVPHEDVCALPSVWATAVHLGPWTC